MCRSTRLPRVGVWDTYGLLHLRLRDVPFDAFLLLLCLFAGVGRLLKLLRNHKRLPARYPTRNPDRYTIRPPRIYIFEFGGHG